MGAGRAMGAVPYAPREVEATALIARGEAIFRGLMRLGNELGIW